MVERTKLGLAIEQGLKEAIAHAKGEFELPTAVCEVPVGTELGDLCRRCGCNGHIAIEPVENCCCHIVAPCGACENARLQCSECGEIVE